MWSASKQKGTTAPWEDVTLSQMVHNYSLADRRQMQMHQKVKIENIYVDSKYKDKEASRGQANTDYLRMPS